MASVVVVGMTFSREERQRERERALFVLLHLRSGCFFFSEFERRKESVCMWVFFSFFLVSGIVFLVFFFFFF